MTRNRERSFRVSPITVKKPRPGVTCGVAPRATCSPDSALSPASPARLAGSAASRGLAAGEGATGCGVRSSKPSRHAQALTVLHISPPCAHAREVHAAHGADPEPTLGLCPGLRPRWRERRFPLMGNELKHFTCR